MSYQALQVSATDYVNNGLYDRLGIHHITTSQLSGRAAKQQPTISAADFPGRKQSNYTQKHLPRGYSITWELERESSKGVYTQHATLINDTKIVGFKYNCAYGKTVDTKVQRRLRKLRGKSVDVASFEVRALYLSTPFLCNGGKSRLCELDRHYAGTA